MHCSELLKRPCLLPPSFCLALLKFISAACSQRFWLMCMTVTGIIIGFESSIFQLLHIWKPAGVFSKSLRKEMEWKDEYGKSEKNGGRRRARCAPFNLQPDTTVSTTPCFSTQWPLPFVPGWWPRWSVSCRPPGLVEYCRFLLRKFPSTELVLCPPGALSTHPECRYHYPIIVHQR